MSEVIKKVFFQSKLPYEVQVLKLDKLFLKHSQQLILPHRANFYQIFVLENCHPRHFIDFKSIQLNSCQVLTINKECVQYFDKDNKYCGYLIIFTDDFFSISEKDKIFLHNLPIFNNSNLFSVLSIKEDLEYLELQVKILSRELEKQNYPFKKEFLHNTLSNLLISINAIYQNHEPSNIIADPDTELSLLFKDLIEQNYAKQRSLYFYYKKLIINEKKLQMATKKVFGKSPKDILEERVILEAKRLLLYSNLSVKEIALNLGFDDTAYFFRYFKQRTKTTPKEFRIKNQFISSKL